MWHNAACFKRTTDLESVQSMEGNKPHAISTQISVRGSFLVSMFSSQLGFSFTSKSYYRLGMDFTLEFVS